MRNISRLLVISINIFSIFSAIKNVEAPPPDPSAQLEVAFIDFEKKADELIASGREFFMQLLQDETARKTIGVIILGFKHILEDKSASVIIISVSQQIKDTLTDGDRGALSVKYINDGVVDLLTNPLIEETFQALLESFSNVIHNPGTPIVMDQMFDVITELAKLQRGTDLVETIEDGFLTIIRRPNPREYIFKGCTNAKTLFFTGTREKFMNFVSG